MSSRTALNTTGDLANTDGDIGPASWVLVAG